MSARSLYKVVFLSQGKVYEIYARNVTQGTLFGFIEVERLVFGERSSVVIDPAEERIRTEFAGVRRTYLPLHSILRIDEVEKQGVSKISAAEGSNVSQFPTPIYTPAPSGDAGPVTGPQQTIRRAADFPCRHHAGVGWCRSAVGVPARQAARGDSRQRAAGQPDCCPP